MENRNYRLEIVKIAVDAIRTMEKVNALLAVYHQLKEDHDKLRKEFHEVEEKAIVAQLETSLTKEEYDLYRQKYYEVF